MRTGGGDGNEWTGEGGREVEETLREVKGRGAGKAEGEKKEGT